MQSLQNYLLIATPTMGDPYFSRTVTYICEHNEHGTMGLVINQPVGMTLKQLVEQSDENAIVLDKKAGGIVLAGGPVSNSWLTIEADLELLFDVPIHKKWEMAVQKLGIDIWQLGPDIGHA